MSAFPQTLKKWRAIRRFSQMELALEAEVSSRHLSFLETGRARPSREMIARLGDALQLPLSARNQMLTHAGFAVRYPGRKWESEEIAPIRKSIEHMLSNHMPYPGIALDRLWVLRGMNKAGARLFGQLGVNLGDSLLELLMSDHLPQIVENWPDVAHHLAVRLRTESLAQGGVPELDRAYSHLQSTNGTAQQPVGPVLPTILRMDSIRLSMFATISQFGTPEDVTLDDLKIELYFPMDESSDRLLRELAET